jgi:hypothetical protein
MHFSIQRSQISERALLFEDSGYDSLFCWQQQTDEYGALIE